MTYLKGDKQYNFITRHICNKGEVSITKIYVDVLIFVNFIISLLLIKACDSLLRNKAKAIRIILASFVCSLSSLAIFIPPIGFWLNLLLKLTTAFVVTICAFGIKNIKKLLINCTAFFLISISFAAIMMAVWMAISPAIMTVSNGSVYFDVSPIVLIVGSLGCYGVITLLEKLFAKRLPNEMCFDILVTVNGITVKIPAMLDTGNTLTDPISGCPVIVAQYDALKPLMGRDNSTKAIWINGGNAASQVLSSDWKRRYRCISFSSVGGSGLLSGFKPDSAFITVDKIIHKLDCIIAVYDGQLADDGNRAIFGKQLLDSVGINF